VADLSGSVDLRLRRDPAAALEDSVLGLYLGELTAAVAAGGEIVVLHAGERIDRADGLDEPGSLPVVVLAGCVDGPGSWFGPGNHLRGPGPFRARTGSGDVVLWMPDRDAPAWRGTAGADLLAAVHRAVDRAAAAEAAATRPAWLPAPADTCDVEHPAIRATAERLRRDRPADSAAAVFGFVRTMPYRFGYWLEYASTTLERGTGMCTTKSNVQVALLRALGLEAGFVEVEMPITILGSLMPPAWVPLMRPVVRHYFAAVRLGGRWHACDCSYTDQTVEIYAQALPHLAHALVPVVFDEGKPYSPAAIARGEDVFEIAVLPDVHDEMGKESRFLPHHFEALNVRLDRVQGRFPNFRPGT